MPRDPITVHRLFVAAPLHAGAVVKLEKPQAHYLLNVLRRAAGDSVLLFNGSSGEWRAVVTLASKRECVLTAVTQTRLQIPLGGIWYCFAPLKSARLDYMVQKAVEMGAGRLMPVISQHCVAQRVNLERMRANAIEAAEQCGILAVPPITEPRSFRDTLALWPEGRVIAFCDEAADAADPVLALKTIPRGAPAGVFIGPEGGFSGEERSALLAMPQVLRLSLGPRIMRADTAGVAALALVQAVIGDMMAGAQHAAKL